MHMHETVLFRCNASPQLGSGHLYRCCTLAAEIVRQGGRSLMLGPAMEVCPAEFAHVFAEWKQCSFEDETADAVRTCEFSGLHQINKLVLDDYRISDDYQQILKQNDLHWLQFDGTGQKNLWADWVVNAMPGTTADVYADKLKNPRVRLLLGPDYALLRPDFAMHALPDSVQQRAGRVFVFAGGGDDKHVLKLLLGSMLSMDTSLTLCAVSTSSNPGLSDLLHWVHQNSMGKVELHIDAQDMPALMRSCAMAFVSAGTVTYEINCTGLPMVLFSMADNQIAQALAWVESTGAKYLGDYRQLTVAAIQGAVSELLVNLDTPVKRLVDGQGARRIVQELMEFDV